jgi:hypothetical protein
MSDEVSIPATWKSYYGEEAFQDIRVYVEYGDKTPEEAVVILGLKPIPPPEKTEEPKQVKPSEEKIEVRTSEIPIKEDTNKEVKKMDQQNEGEKMEKLFPNTNFVGKDGAGFFPNTSFQGLEEIEIPVPPVAKGATKGVASMHLDELPGYVASQLEDAFANSHSKTCQSMDHYIGVVEGGKYFDESSLKEMKGFRKQLGDAGEYGERKAILDKTVKFLRGMKSEKRGGEEK